MTRLSFSFVRAVGSLLAAFAAFATFAAFAAFAPGTADAATLRYAWKAKKTYRFAAESDTAVKMTGMGMNVASKFHTTSTFALKIKRVRPNGLAEGEILIESFRVEDDGGRLLAGLEGLPKGALKNRIEIDAKGRFEFKEIVYIVVDETGHNVLVSGKVGPNGASTTGSATVGDEKVTVYARFDPKSGRLTGGYSVKKVGKKKERSVAIKKDAQKVDILPAQFLEMLRLPDGDVSAGQSHTFEVAGSKLTVRVDALDAKSATLTSTVRSAIDTTAVAAPVVAAAADDDLNDDGFGDDGFDNSGFDEGGGADPGMPDMAAMPGMGAMGMPGMGGGTAHGMGGGAIPGAGGGMGIKLSGTFTMKFDVARGTLRDVAGNLGTETSAGGMMKIESASTLSLRALD